jgi:tRNA uridine 5-carboxymethylaminomethyl modification enzyme
MFDTIVIGGGHAGCEAACAAARRGARVALVTFRLNDLGQMSCNPSIGGVGKGHLAREIDAMGGVMAIAADRSAIHRRMLNASKGSAVRGPRVQADRRRYRSAVSSLVRAAGVTLVEAEVAALGLGSGRIRGVTLADGSRLDAATVIVTTGTFLGAEMFRGEERWEGGRFGGQSAQHLAAQVRELGLAQDRLKTGTPPRLDGRTIDWSRTLPQPSDRDQWTMAIARNPTPLPQLACAITRTNERSHDVIREGLGRSPLFGGAIGGRGPRYCPSIEDKVDRFGDRDGHQIFLEPECLDDVLVYPNGISTSLPTDVQIGLVRTISGLERAEIVQPGYAVEYQYADPRRLSASLGHRDLPGLFFAGQINGTTGYEEAAAQGLVAGLNASALALDLEAAHFDRADSYIGVMVDDLTIQGVSEPYRMLTARSEHRLHLRADNAVSRLGPMALALGALGADQRCRVEDRLEAKQSAVNALEQRVTGTELGVADVDRRSLAEWARRAETLSAVRARLPSGEESMEALDDAIYAPYLERQKHELAARHASRATAIPENFDYAVVPGLSTEMRERLSVAGPANLDQAGRVPGVTPAALSALHFALVRAAA